MTLSPLVNPEDESTYPQELVDELNSTTQVGIALKESYEQFKARIAKYFEVAQKHVTQDEAKQILRKWFKKNGLSDSTYYRALPAEVKNPNRIEAGRNNILNHQQFRNKDLTVSSDSNSLSNNSSGESAPIPQLTQSTPTDYDPINEKVRQLEDNLKAKDILVQSLKNELAIANPSELQKEIVNLRARIFQLEVETARRNTCGIPKRLFPSVARLLRNDVEAVELTFNPQTGEVVDVEKKQ